jgi:hypothetical protein
MGGPAPAPGTCTGGRPSEGERGHGGRSAARFGDRPLVHVCAADLALGTRSSPHPESNNPGKREARSRSRRPDPAYRLWLTAEVDGMPVYMRMNPTFPEDPLYSLLVAEDETVDLDDLPETWRREGPLEWPDAQ